MAMTEVRRRLGGRPDRLCVSALGVVVAVEAVLEMGVAECFDSASSDVWVGGDSVGLRHRLMTRPSDGTPCSGQVSVQQWELFNAGGLGTWCKG